MSISNPAEIASKETLTKMFEAIEANQCFRLEAGAGAGKTYSLIKALNYLIKKKGNAYLRNCQQIVCITYTNVAKDEIIERTDNNPAVLTETIHGFAWSLIKVFQKQLLSLIPGISEKWTERIEAIGGISNQSVSYDLGYPNATGKELTLHHDDVIILFRKFLEQPKFQQLLQGKYPIIFIDEYQDTNKELTESIISNLIESDIGILVGFFGDHWQKIYGKNACGLISDANGKIKEINKGANFRSNKVIVEMLNRMRPELPQQVSDQSLGGQIKIFHSNDWNDIRRTENHWQEDLPMRDAHDYLERTKVHLSSTGWDFNVNKTKILMLTHNVLAAEQGYKNILDCFKNSDDYLKGNDPYIKYFTETLVPIRVCFEQLKYGEMFQIIGKDAIALTCQQDKEEWNKDLQRLIETMKSGTVDDVLTLLNETQHPRLSAKVEEKERSYHLFKPLTPEDFSDEKDLRFFTKISNLRKIKFTEVEKLYEFINEKTLFSTKHGVKGAEFENVLVVCGRGWNQYDWNKLLEWMSDAVPTSKIETFERNRNLFYVACSRSKKRFSILFTQKLSVTALNSVKRIFGEENVIGEP
ncbi:MAG: UvrD-helicase domain-containing protein [Clostridiales bacterium]|nr:UvrD-helicase domain-containing protein [Clostridiales bacterium]